MAQLPQPGGQQRSQQQFVIFEQFEKMNTKDGRIGLKENELAWQENLQPIAPNKLLTVPAAAAAALATLSETIKLMFYAAINGVDYFICFTTTGAGFAINIGTGVVTQFAADGTFSTAPDVTTWQASRIIINDSTAGYCTWDGTTFVQQTGVSPNITVTNGGANYGVPPTVAIVGGSGTGAQATAVLQDGSVIAINLINPGVGYQATDNLIITITPAGGTGATASVTMSGFNVATLINGGGGLFSTPGFGTWPLTITGGGGSGAAGTATVVLDPSGFFTISGLTLTNGGSGYTSPPSVTLTHTGGPVAPILAATLGVEHVQSITLLTGGSGYATGTPVAFIGGNPTRPAAATATVVGGVITVLTLTDTGAGYKSKPTIQFTGGSGAQAFAHVWPFVPAGTTLAVFQGRVWLGGGTLLQWTGLGSNILSGTNPAFSSLISSGAYNNTTGVVTLTLATAATFSAGASILIANLTGTGSFASLAGIFTAATVSANGLTVTYNAAISLGTSTITGGTLSVGSVYGNVGYDDFRAATASGSLQITDADLVHQISALRSLNNYLFIVGDQSVKQIGNISLDATGLTTLFTILTLSSDQGTIYPRSCLSYDRIFMFVAPEGVYGVFGSTVQKISPDLDGIFKLVNFSQQPQSALLDLNAIHNAAWLLRYQDPVAGTRSIIVMFDGKRWFVTSQGNSIAAIASAPLLSSNTNSLYGTLTGTDVTQLFAAPNTPVTFKAITSLTPHGNAVQGKKIIRAGFTADASGAGSVGVELDADSATQALTFAVTATSVLVGGTNDSANTPANLAGVNIGMTLTGTLANFTLANMIIEFQDIALWRS